MDCVFEVIFDSACDRGMVSENEIGNVDGWKTFYAENEEKRTAEHDAGDDDGATFAQRCVDLIPSLHCLGNSVGATKLLHGFYEQVIFVGQSTTPGPVEPSFEVLPRHDE